MSQTSLAQTVSSVAGSPGRRAIFFSLRGLLGVAMVGILFTYKTPISGELWLLGTVFLISDLVILFFPLAWYKNPTIGYALFFFDIAVLTIFFCALTDVGSDSLLLYYLTVFMATLGGDLRKSVGIAVVAGALYIGVQLGQGTNLIENPSALMHLPLFFVTAVSSGYLAQEALAHRRRIQELHATHKGLEAEIDRSAQNLSESERLRAVAETSELRYRNLVHDLEPIVWEADAASLQFTFVSHRAEEVLGYPVDKWVSLPDFFDHLVMADDRAQALEDLEQAVLGGRKHESEFRVLTQDDRILWLRNMVRVTRDPNGAARHLRGMMVDVTERKKAEKALQQLNRQIELILNSAGEGIFGLDLAGCATFVNATASEMLGWKVDEIIGRPCHPLLHHSKPGGSLYPIEACPIYAAFKDGVVHQSNEEVFWKKDGTSFPVEYISTPMRDESGKVVGAVVAFRDITSGKELEYQFRHAQKMEAVGRLAGGVAHDFNNLLTIISGYTELIEMGLPPENPLRAHASEVLKAGERAAALTRQLLAFSRQQVMAPQVLDLNSVVTNIHKMLRRLIGEDVELTTISAPDLGTVRADPGQIEQVIMNMAVNARDAMPEGGKLTIETSNVDLDTGYARIHFPIAPGRYVQLSISDTGCGMDEEVQKHIFEPFFTTKEHGKGTGLGLATVYGIVKQSDGYIWVYSEKGNGTTFKIYLPRVDAPVVVTGEGQTERKSVRGSETVLVVEDETSLRKLVCGVLKSNGYRVLEASRGEEALRISGQHEGAVQLLLTDVVMPQMSGRHLAEQLASLRPQTKVLFMSGYTDDAIVHHGVLEPGMDFLQKPFTPESLARKVREVLDKPQ